MKEKKNRVGRPRLIPVSAVDATVRLSTRTYDAVCEGAREKNISVSQLLRDIIEDWGCQKTIAGYMEEELKRRLEASQKFAQETTEAISAALGFARGCAIARDMRKAGEQRQILIGHDGTVEIEGRLMEKVH